MRKKLSIISLLLFMALISHSYAADINPINFDSLADKDSLDNKCKTKSDDYLNNFYLNAGFAYGPETLVGPEVSIDYYPFKTCSLYCGVQLGWQFPAATLAGNLGVHAGYTLGPLFFETSFTAYTQASPVDRSWSEHYTTNFKIGFKIYNFYFKVGPGYYLRGDPFSSQIFLEVDGIPINFELGGSWSFKELKNFQGISLPYPTSIFDLW
ncbi:MAG: hypothetical protein PF588_04740 [Candidatus Kapabacteria bacterium]|jgi:hypothetical protein|nr:hypothetical protein [Candidatus Kapabacteria bacterium]